MRGDQLEQQVWSDIEKFLRNPGEVLAQIQRRLKTDASASASAGKQIRRLEALLPEKAIERERVVGLYRRGRISDLDLDQQMEQIGSEEGFPGTASPELEERHHRGRIG